MASTISYGNNFIIVLIALCGFNRWFVTGYTFHIFDNVVGKTADLHELEDARITPESTVPELKKILKLSKWWPHQARAFYINGGLAKEDKQIKYFAPKGTEILVIGFVSDPAGKYIFRKEDETITPFQLYKKLPEAVIQSGAIKYTFVISRDVLGRPSAQVTRMYTMKRDTKVQDLEKALKDSGLWPAGAKAMYINGRCTSGFQTLASFVRNGNKRLVIEFVEDPSAIYTFLVKTGKEYELFQDPDQKFQTKELLTNGDIRTPIGPLTTMTRLKMKLKKAKKWPMGKKVMLINGMKTCMRKVEVGEEPCDKDLVRNYRFDGLLKIDFI
ncbi:hypothetical protein Ddc_14662 [Ditylenchus destructor]|nr:hypothetical protein Ddc_14662 [Ditylenchus destructor]